MKKKKSRKRKKHTKATGDPTTHILDTVTVNVKVTLKSGAGVPGCVVYFKLNEQGFSVTTKDDGQIPAQQLYQSDSAISITVNGPPATPPHFVTEWDLRGGIMDAQSFTVILVDPAPVK